MNLRSYIVTAATFLYVILASIRLSVSTGLSHDEHQFMASAFMVAEYNLHPYKDFPYFHMPNLVYLYALIFRFTDYPFLAARLFCGLCGAAISLILFLVARSCLSENRHWISLLIPASLAVVLTHSPSFATAASHVWNHTPSTLCAVLSFLFYCRGVGGVISRKYFFLSGFCLGLAISIRLAFAPTVIPFVAAMFFPPVKNAERKLAGIVAFACGGLVASAPAIYFLIAHTEQFLFGNLDYPSLNFWYREELGYQGAMTLGGKLNSFVGVMAKPGNLLVVGVALSSMLGLLFKPLGEVMRSRVEIVLLVFLLPFLIIGSLAPTPSFAQYFFGPIAFIMLLAPYGLAQPQIIRASRTVMAAVVLAMIGSLTFGVLPGLRESKVSLLRPKSWYPVQFHERSVEIAKLVLTGGKVGKVLTLAPLSAVEIRLPVYRQFVTGPFAWRISHLLSPADRLRQSITSPAELASLLQHERPAAILTNTEDRNLEEPLVQAAVNLGYQQKHLSDGRILWIPAP